ncbi:hypothetical protein DYI37_18175 [Fulvimarina endophytica]|uniref:C4-dicarboxylate ABC transporter substrate-binding protein n=1 Tax=Fulvimarina endophytica TaxID=2293836 RepID=A0A371WYC2_9HYPH|nr:TRAP transporter substrate-binding protein DctP [Fulvimarina endophytica]RFC61981.1 hypothetical protein DYI37_18175 [Fulvimarina endophytica]
MKIFATGLCAAAVTLAVTSAHAEDRTLRVATSVPQHHYLTRAIQTFADRVNERTDGEISFEVYPAQSLVTDQQMDQAVANGTVDIGIASASILAGTIPAFNIFAVPFYFDTREKLDHSVTRGNPIRTTLDEEIEKKGLHAAFWIPYGSIAMVTRDKPVHVPDDMKGMKIRTFGSTVSEFVEAVGAAPVVTSGGEQFLALQRGIVDGGLTGWSSVTDRRLYEVSKYVVATDHMYETHFALMSSGVWDSLSPETQKIFQEVGEEMESELMDEIFTVNDKAKAELSEKMDVIELTDAEKTQWKEATRSVAEHFYESGDDVSKTVFEEAEKVQ